VTRSLTREEREEEAAPQRSVFGGDEEEEEEEEEMFSVIEPVRGMSTVKFISYNIIFYVRV